jgi:hypothetical protein
MVYMPAATHGGVERWDEPNGYAVHTARLCRCCLCDPNTAVGCACTKPPLTEQYICHFSALFGVQLPKWHFTLEPAKLEECYTRGYFTGRIVAPISSPLAERSGGSEVCDPVSP